LNRLLQQFATYSSSKIELEKSQGGDPNYRNSYSETRLKEAALEIKTQCIKINKLDYGW